MPKVAEFGAVIFRSLDQALVGKVAQCTHSTRPPNAMHAARAEV